MFKVAEKVTGINVLVYFLLILELVFKKKKILTQLLPSSLQNPSVFSELQAKLIIVGSNTALREAVMLLRLST